MQSDAGVSGFSMRFRPRNKFLKGFKKILAPQIINSVTQGNVRVPVSRQTAILLNAYTGAAAATPYLCGSVDLADCQAVLGATEPSPATQTSPNNTTSFTRRMMMQAIRAKYTLKNATNTPIEITLYDVTSRRDQQSLTLSPITSWDNGLVDQSITIPGVTPQNPLNSSFPGAKPFQSQNFCQTWKVKRVSHFVLGAGSTHQHYVTIKPGGLINNEYCRQFAALKGLTTAVMAVVKGSVAQDTTTPFNVSFAPCELDFVCETSYRFTAMEKSRTGFTQFSSLPATMTTPSTVLEDSDIVQTVVTV